MKVSISASSLKTAFPLAVLSLMIVMTVGNESVLNEVIHYAAWLACTFCFVMCFMSYVVFSIQIKGVMLGHHDTEIKEEAEKKEELRLAEKETLGKNVSLILSTLFSFFIFSFANDWSYLALLVLMCGCVEVIVNIKSLKLTQMIEDKKIR